MFKTYSDYFVLYSTIGRGKYGTYRGEETDDIAFAKPFKSKEEAKQFRERCFSLHSFDVVSISAQYDF